MIPMDKSCELLILSIAFLYVSVKCIDPTADSKGKCQTLSMTTFPVTAAPQSMGRVLITWDLHGYDVRDWIINVYAGQRFHYTARLNSDVKSHMVINLKPGLTYSVILNGQNSNGPCLQASPVNVTLNNPTRTRRPSFRRLNDNGTNDGEVLDLVETENVTVRYETAEQETPNIREVLIIASITFGISVGLLLLLMSIFCTVQHITKTSDKFTLRRNSKRESAKKLVPHNADVGNEEVATERAIQADNLQSPASLTVPNTNQRNTVCSVVSWGSEFELADQGDSIYSNAGCQPSYATCPRPQRDQPTGPHHLAQRTLPNSMKNNFPRHNVTSGTTDCGLNMVIPPQTGGEIGIYDNVSIAYDQNDIYVNS